MTGERQKGRRGRPKGSRSTSTILRELANELVTVREPGGSRQVPLKEALLLKLRQVTIQGDIRADRFADKLRAQVAPEERTKAQLLLVTQPLSEAEWIRRAEIENRLKQPPADPFPDKAPPPRPVGPPPRAGRKVATAIVPRQPPPRLIR